MYKAGSHWKICDSCGFKTRSELIKKRWDGLMVCPDDYEIDHPQKFIRVSSDGQPVTEPRPRPQDLIPYQCYIYGKQAYADIAEADCSQADSAAFTYQYCVEMKGTA